MFVGNPIPFSPVRLFYFLFRYDGVLNHFLTTWRGRKIDFRENDSGSRFPNPRFLQQPHNR